MAFPTTITTGGSVSIGCGGPYISSGGNVYVIVQDDVTESKFRAFKATDPTSSFSNVGTDPQVTVGNTITGIAAYQVGDVIHVITQDKVPASNTYNLRYHIFNMSSDTWTTTNEVIVSSFVAATSGITNLGVDISVRSDGDVIVLYNGVKVANMGVDRDRVYYARRESAVWTVNVLVDDGGAVSWIASGIVIGSSDRMHLFFADGSNSDGYQRCLRSANTLETFPASYDTSASANDPDHHLGRGISYDSSGTQKVRFPLAADPSSVRTSAKCDSADTPTMSVNADITGTTNVLANSNFSVESTTLWHTFIDNPNSDIFTQSNANDAGWSAPASFYTGTVTNVFTNVYTRGSDIVLGIVFTETDPKYHEKVLVVGGNTFSTAAAATVTWSSKSTASSNLSAAAAASLTWDGNGIYPAALTSTAVASVSWVGAEVAGATAADWSAAAVASLTWDGTGLYPAAITATAVASVTWSSASTVASAWAPAAAASLTWNGAATASSALSAAAAGTLTWDGTEIWPAAWAATAVASVTWNGAGVAVEAAAMNLAATAAVTWNGAAEAIAAFSDIAAATLTLTGAAHASGAMAPAAVASLAWNEAANAAADWSAAALANQAWVGAEVAGAAGAGDATIIAAADAQFTSSATAAGDFVAITSASVTFTGQAISPVSPAKNLDGWKPKRQQLEKLEELEEEDILFIAAALVAYLEQNNVYY